MIGCPVCGSPNVDIDLRGEARSATCQDCEASWLQKGSRQVGVQPGKLRGVPDRRGRGLAVIPLDS